MYPATAQAKTGTIQGLDLGAPGSFLAGQISDRQEEFLVQRESRERKTALGICGVEGIRCLHTSFQHVLSFFLPLLPVVCPDSEATDNSIIWSVSFQQQL